MKSREISWSKIGPFSLAYTDPYIGIGREYQSIFWIGQDSLGQHSYRQTSELGYQSFANP